MISTYTRRFDGDRRRLRHAGKDERRVLICTRLYHAIHIQILTERFLKNPLQKILMKIIKSGENTFKSEEILIDKTLMKLK